MSKESQNPTTDGRSRRIDFITGEHWGIFQKESMEDSPNQELRLQGAMTAVINLIGASIGTEPFALEVVEAILEEWFGEGVMDSDG